MSTTPSKTARAKSIGHYILMKTIGEGTFGKVKLGTHILTGERVAVKVLEKERIVELADVERVAREIHILKLIRHPHIIQLYEIIETPRQLYLIMEYAGGGELFDYIVKAGTAQEPEACRFLHQILAGMEKVHAMRVVHRDLKPENLLLDDRMDIKIADFGLSNTYQDGELLSTACGSPCYAAPEMIAGHKYVPSLVDIWSCGVILFALVCGCLPFEDQNHAELYRKILNAEYELPNFLSNQVRDLITGMLTTEPTRRVTLDGIRLHQWYTQIPEASIRDESSESAIHLDEGILDQLDSYGFPREYAVKCLRTNKHNHATTTYYLLRSKRQRALAGGHSATNLAIADLDATGFDHENVVMEHPPPLAMEAVAAIATPARRGRREMDPSLSGRRLVTAWLDREPRPQDIPEGKDALASQDVGNGRTPPTQAARHRRPDMGVPRLNLGGLSHEAPDPRKPAGGPVSGPSMRAGGSAGSGVGSGRSLPSPRATARSHRGGYAGEAGTPTPQAMWVATPRQVVSAETPRAVHSARGVPAADGYPVAVGQGRPAPARRPSGQELVGGQRAASPRGPYGEWLDVAGDGHGFAPDSEASPRYHRRAADPPLTARPRMQGDSGYRERSSPSRGNSAYNGSQTGYGGPARIRGRSARSGRAPYSARGTQDTREARGEEIQAQNAPSGACEVSCNSTRPPRQLMQEVVRALSARRVSHRQVSNFLIRCQNQAVRFEAECLQRDRGGGYMLRFSRVSGDVWLYKDLCSRLLSEMFL